MVISINPLFDALPYIDKELNEPKLQEKAELLIQEEMNLEHSDYVEPCELPKELNTSKLELFEKEFERLKDEISLNGLNMENYQIKNSNGIDNNQLATLIQHQTIRNLNLNLLEKYGINTWTVNHFQLDKASSNLETELSYMKDQTLAIHKQRKTFQLDQGKKIDQLKKKFKDSVNANLQLELAIQQLEMELNNSD